MPFAGYEDFEACVDDNSDKRDPEAYCAAIKRRVEASGPNMSPSDMRAWRDTEAYAEYKEYHDRQEWADESVREIWNRALRVIEGEASNEEEKKVMAYIARHKAQQAGERRFGSGNTAVSAHTAALRNWGFDTTERLSEPEGEQAGMSEDCPTRLEKLPKGSNCRDYKQVPARSSYWQDETDSVERCADWATDGGDGADSDASDEGASDDSQTEPEDVGVWEYQGGDNRHPWVHPTGAQLTVFRGSGGNFGRYSVVVANWFDETRYWSWEGEFENISKDGARYIEFDNAVANATSWMQDNQQREEPRQMTDLPEAFDLLGRGVIITLNGEETRYTVKRVKDPRRIEPVEVNIKGGDKFNARKLAVLEGPRGGLKALMNTFTADWTLWPMESTSSLRKGAEREEVEQIGILGDEETLEQPCPYAPRPDGGMLLCEPLQQGDEAPAVDSLSLADGDSIVWTFPNADGCRCGSQALQLDTLASKRDVKVYGIAADAPEDMKEMQDSLELDSVQLIADPDAELADKFGVELNDKGNLPRRLFFVRDGRVRDVSDGVGPTLAQPSTCPYGERGGNSGQSDAHNSISQWTADMPTTLSQSDEKVHQHMQHPGVYVVTGRRGSGKSAAAFEIAEQLSESQDIKKVTVGMPSNIQDEFPGSWYHVETLNAAPDRSVVVVDESYMSYNARTPLADDNQSLGPLVNTSRHCEQTMLFVTQNSAMLDKSAVGEADGLYVKKPGALHTRFERRAIRDLTEQADKAFQQLPESLDKRQYGYLYTDRYQGMVENSKPSWYTESISKSFAGACGSTE